MHREGSAKVWVLVAVLLVGGGVALYIGAGGALPWDRAVPTSNNLFVGSGGTRMYADPYGQPLPASAPGNGASRPATGPGASAAKDLFDRGVQLMTEGKIVSARETLSDAYFTGQLSPDLEAQARAKLEDLANRTLFSTDVMDGDIYSDRYRVKPGDSLQKIERAQSLHVPAELLAKVNNIEPGNLQEGRTIKLIRGPFHAVVYKSKFAMDVFIQRDTGPKIFVRRFEVGLGRNGSTPVGNWHVRLGRPPRPATAEEPAQGAISGKLRHARFDPPPNCEIDHSIMWGEANYPFGEKGLFIPLEGDDENTARMLNYGIHSTNDQASIGKEGSLGCVRLRDADIESVFNLLYEKWSTVQTRP